MKTLIPTFCATAVMFIACVRAADKVYVDEVAAFGKVVDIWPDGKMPGDKTDKPEVFDNGQPKGDVMSCRPDATILVYPGGLLKGGFRAKATPDLALSEQTMVTEETPPVYITQTEDDFCQVENSLAYYLACKKCGVPAAMLLGPKGGHGYGSRKAGRDNDDWPELAAKWLKRTFKMPVK